jgi:hypothetical protein
MNGDGVTRRKVRQIHTELLSLDVFDGFHGYYSR